MRDFFVNQWLNFKKNWYWYIIWFLVEFICVKSSVVFIDNFCFYAVGDTCFNSYVFYDHTAFYAIWAFIIFRYFCEFSLYIFSYHIYTGKKNWYKFFREREKIHKKEDSNAYKEYLKQIKDSTMQNKKED